MLVLPFFCLVAELRSNAIYAVDVCEQALYITAYITSAYSRTLPNIVLSTAATHVIAGCADKKIYIARLSSALYMYPRFGFAVRAPEGVLKRKIERSSFFLYPLWGARPLANSPFAKGGFRGNVNIEYTIA